MKLVNQNYKVSDEFVPEIELTVSFTLHELQDGRALGEEYYSKVGKEILALLDEGKE